MGLGLGVDLHSVFYFLLVQRLDCAYLVHFVRCVGIAGDVMNVCRLWLGRLES
jgi:hypothetical protein